MSLLKIVWIEFLFIDSQAVLESIGAVFTEGNQTGILDGRGSVGALTQGD